MNLIIPYSELDKNSLAEAGGKNASLGEMIRKLSQSGIRVPDGFAVSASAYRLFLNNNDLTDQLASILNKLDKNSLSNLQESGKACRELIDKAVLPEELWESIVSAYKEMGTEISVAVRSSATAEDLPSASFAGQHDSFLNVCGEKQLLIAVKKCYVSLFNDRAIKYRIDHGFDHLQVYLSVGIQQMVRSDLACAGVAFTLDPESGFDKVVYITGSWGLGELVVQGAVSPDEFYFYKPNLENGKPALLNRKKGQKEQQLIYSNDKDNPLQKIKTAVELRQHFILNENELNELAEWCLKIEKHYGTAMDIEWAKDGNDGKLYIVQARPETVFTGRKPPEIIEYSVIKSGKTLCKGKAVGNKIVSGIARIINSPEEGWKIREGDIIVSEITNPDWNTLLRKAIGIVTNRGGRTSHASIIARELGIPAVVGTGNATTQVRDGQEITLNCASGDQGFIYEGKAIWEEKKINPEQFDKTLTDPLLILADPDQAFKLRRYPARGVGLLRMEFIIANQIRIHPLALIHYDKLKDGPEKKQIDELTVDYEIKSDYFIHNLSRGIATIASAFYPHEVIVRMSDFKSNEYASLLGGSDFEPPEDNPMIGFRGASRYYSDFYRKAFSLECEAVKKARMEMGFDNIRPMIPFCRTPEEAGKVLNEMANNGLRRGENGLEIYMMIEIPSNVLQAEEFAELFDGFSIGSNDLTQLTLGIDRDSELLGDLFNEMNPSVLRLIKETIQIAHKKGIRVGLCGQAPSDKPEFANFLVKEKIDSISFNRDALMRGIQNIHDAEYN